jgi:ABC-2 type transport system permease protein
VTAGSSFLFVAGKYLLSSVGMICMATFAFAISSLVRNSALSIGLGIFLYFSGSMAVLILNQLGIYQAKYVLFANTDINAVMNGTTGFINHSLGFALINIAVYMIVFILIAWDGFVRNEIK